MPEPKVPEILERAITPESLFSDDYERFKADRATLLAQFGRRLASL